MILVVVRPGRARVAVPVPACGARGCAWCVAFEGGVSCRALAQGWCGAGYWWLGELFTSNSWRLISSTHPVAPPFLGQEEKIARHHGSSAEAACARRARGVGTRQRTGRCPLSRRRCRLRKTRCRAGRCSHRRRLSCIQCPSWRSAHRRRSRGRSRHQGSRSHLCNYPRPRRRLEHKGAR